MAVAALAGLAACKAGQEGGGGQRAERASYYLLSSSLQPLVAGGNASTRSALIVGPGSSPCTIAGTQGVCLTPTRARGMVVNLSLGQGSTQPMPGAPPGPPGPSDARPARLFGFGEGLDREGKIALAPFDLGNPRAIPGAGALQDASPGTNFALLDTLFGYMDVQVALDNKYWTLRFAFYPQPIAEDPAAKMCADKGLLERIAQNGAVIPGAPPFARGDVLFCEKANAAEECAPGDFKWLDASNAQLVATRPAQPRQLDFIVKEGIACKLHPEGPTEANHHQPGELKFNGFRMSTRLSAPVSVWARYDQCNTTYSLKDAATGQITEGTSLAATVNYNLEGFVFFPGIADLGAASLADLLAAATLTPLHAREKLGPGPASAEFSTASVALALGQQPHAPCGGPDNWDGGGAGPPPAASAPRVGAADAGASGLGDMGTGGGGDGPGQGMADARPSSGNGPGPSDAADGIHPATSLPPGCVPDMAIRLTVDGQACAHKACPAPEWQPIPVYALVEQVLQERRRARLQRILREPVLPRRHRDHPQHHLPAQLPLRARGRSGLRQMLKTQ